MGFFALPMLAVFPALALLSFIVHRIIRLLRAARGHAQGSLPAPASAPASVTTFSAAKTRGAARAWARTTAAWVPAALAAHVPALARSLPRVPWVRVASDAPDAPRPAQRRESMIELLPTSAPPPPPPLPGMPVYEHTLVDLSDPVAGPSTPYAYHPAYAAPAPPVLPLPRPAAFLPAPKALSPAARTASPHARLATTPPPPPHRRSRSLGGVPVRRLSGGSASPAGGSGLRHALGVGSVKEGVLVDVSAPGAELDVEEEEASAGGSSAASDIGLVVPARALSLKPLSPARLVDLDEPLLTVETKERVDDAAWRWFGGPPILPSLPVRVVPAVVHAVPILAVPAPALGARKVEEARIKPEKLVDVDSPLVDVSENPMTAPPHPVRISEKLVDVPPALVVSSPLDARATPPLAEAEDPFADPFADPRPPAPTTTAVFAPPAAHAHDLEAEGEDDDGHTWRWAADAHENAHEQAHASAYAPQAQWADVHTEPEVDMEAEMEAKAEAEAEVEEWDAEKGQWDTEKGQWDTEKGQQWDAETAPRWDAERAAEDPFADPEPALVLDARAADDEWYGKQEEDVEARAEEAADEIPVQKGAQDVPAAAVEEVVVVEELLQAEVAVEEDEDEQDHANIDDPALMALPGVPVADAEAQAALDEATPEDETDEQAYPDPELLALPELVLDVALAPAPVSPVLAPAAPPLLAPASPILAPASPLISPAPERAPLLRLSQTPTPPASPPPVHTHARAQVRAPALVAVVQAQERVKAAEREEEDGAEPASGVLAAVETQEKALREGKEEEKEGGVEAEKEKENAPPPAPSPITPAGTPRPAWSRRADAAPALGLASSTSSGGSARRVLGDANANVNAGAAAEALVVVEVKAEMKGEVKEEKEEKKRPAEPEAPTKELALERGRSLPGSFPGPAPAPTTSTTSTSTVTTSTAVSAAVTTPVLVKRTRTRAGSWVLPSPAQLARSSPLDIALAMQLRPGLGAGADPAWMVRFLMAVYGWIVVSVAGGF